MNMEQTFFKMKEPRMSNNSKENSSRKRTRRHFPTAQKIKLVEEMNATSPEAVATKYRIHRPLLYRWKKQLTQRIVVDTPERRGEETFSAAYVAHLEKMLAEKTIELERLRYARRSRV